MMELQQMRKQAAAQMATLPLPKADRTNIKNWDFENLVLSDVKHEENSIPQAVAHLVGEEAQNVVILHDGQMVYQRLGTEFDGVDISLIQEEKAVIGEAISMTTNRLTALNVMHLNSGLFIHVPKNQVIETPLQVIYIQDQRSLVNRTVIKADQSSSFRCIENLVNVSQGVVNFLTEVIVGENATVHLSTMENLAKETVTYECRKAKVLANGRLELAYGALSDGNTVAEHIVELVGVGASAEVKTVAIAGGAQKQNVTVQVEHLAPHTEGNIVNHGISQDVAHLTFNGIGKIHKGMNGSNAQQASRAMILSETARADANPLLLIDEYDVKAGHAAGVGKIDEEQLYYLMSRGLTRREAETLIIYGFLMPFIDDIKHESLQAEFTKVIERKLSMQGASA